MDLIDLTIVDEPVQRVLAAWPHARLERVAGSRAQIRRAVCGWLYSHDRLARLSGVTELELARALEVMEATGLVDLATGEVLEDVKVLMRKELAARLRR